MEIHLSGVKLPQKSIVYGIRVIEQRFSYEIPKPFFFENPTAYTTAPLKLCENMVPIHFYVVKFPQEYKFDCLKLIEHI